MKTCKQYREQAWSALQGKWAEAVLMMLVIYVISGVINMPSSIFSTFETYGLDISLPSFLIFTVSGVCAVASILILGPLEWAYVNAILDDAIREKEWHIFPTSWKLFKREFAAFVPAYVLVFIIILLLAIPTLLIGSIIFSLAYAMVPFVIHDNPNIGVVEALRTSRLMMRGHKAKLFLLNLSFIGWIILGILSFGIGMLWISPFMSTAQAAFYEDIRNAEPTTDL